MVSKSTWSTFTSTQILLGLGTHSAPSRSPIGRIMALHAAPSTIL